MFLVACEVFAAYSSELCFQATAPCSTGFHAHGHLPQGHRGKHPLRRCSLLLPASHCQSEDPSLAHYCCYSWNLERGCSLEFELTLVSACCSEVKCLFVGCTCCCLLETNLNGKKPVLFGCSDFWLLITLSGVYVVFCGQCWRTASLEQEQCLADCLLDCFCHCGCCGLCHQKGVMKLIQQNEGQQEHVHQQQP